MIFVLKSQEDAAYPSLEAARAEEGRLKLAFISSGDTVLKDGEYYVSIPEACPYSGRPCVGGGCTPCEFVP